MRDIIDFLEATLVYEIVCSSITHSLTHLDPTWGVTVILHVVVESL